MKDVGLGMKHDGNDGIGHGTGMGLGWAWLTWRIRDGQCADDIGYGHVLTTSIYEN